MRAPAGRPQKLVFAFFFASIFRSISADSSSISLLVAGLKRTHRPFPPLFPRKSPGGPEKNVVVSLRFLASFANSSSSSLRIMFDYCFLRRAGSVSILLVVLYTYRVKRPRVYVHILCAVRVCIYTGDSFNGRFASSPYHNFESKFRNRIRMILFRDFQKGDCSRGRGSSLFPPPPFFLVANVVIMVNRSDTYYFFDPNTHRPILNTHTHTHTRYNTDNS